MNAELLLDAEPAALANPALAEFAQHHPLQIAVCLRKLMTGRDFVTVEFDGRQIVTQVLDVDSRNGRFVFDAGSADADNRLLARAQQLIFRSLPGGVRTEFDTQAAAQIVFDGRPAFEAAFPAQLLYVQRREYFRVQTPLVDPYVASGAYLDGGSFRVELQDISLGGVALRSGDARFGSLAAGSVLQQVTLRLGDAGVLQLDLEIVSPRKTINARGDVQFVMGCRFVGLPGTAERMLQRVVTQLEMTRRRG